MSIFRPLGKLFQQFTQIQQLSPISTTAHLLAGSSKRPKGKPKCHLIKSVGCAPRARKDCQPVPKERKICHRLDVPEPSYAECLKVPRPKHRMSECVTPKFPPKLCIKTNYGISIDGCQPPVAPRQGTCRPRNLKAKRHKKKKCDVCDSDLKPFKSAGPSKESEMSCPSSSTGSGMSCPSANAGMSCPPANAGMSCPSTPMTSRICEPEPSSSPFATPFRNYSTKCGAAAKRKKPCFEKKKIKAKTKPYLATLKSPVCCEGKGIKVNKCDKAKCGSTFEPCNKPAATNKHKCPVRKKKPRMMSVTKVVKKRKIKMGYKTCKQPKTQFQFSCKTKGAKKPVKKKEKAQPTPKRCSCFKPVELPVVDTSCKKIRCAVEPDCNRKGEKAKAICPEKCDKS